MNVFTKPERVIMDELPTLFVYDHCPFCVRVRLALGIKNVKHNLHFLANDDVKTPTSLVGKKIAPIFVSVSRSMCLYSVAFADRL
jgi:glutaredoxin 2